MDRPGQEVEEHAGVAGRVITGFRGGVLEQGGAHGAKPLGQGRDDEARLQDVAHRRPGRMPRRASGPLGIK